MINRRSQPGQISEQQPYDRRTARDGRARGVPGRGKRRDTRLRRTGRLAKVAGGAGGLRPRKAPLGARANRRWLLSCRLSLTRRLRPISHLFPRPSIHIHLCMRAAPEPPPQDSRRQREPEGRSPARSAGKAERSECRAREDYGWGWAGRCKQAVPPTPPNTPAPPTPAAAQAVRRPRPSYRRIAYRRAPVRPRVVLRSCFLEVQLCSVVGHL